ncbi:cytochrome d ubiquinol oxidase subunit II [Vibrio sp. JCM 19053]|nr:cytochrome d ubiquinol oxidase subunit II [Vibrio sp. JCM 19053]
MLDYLPEIYLLLLGFSVFMYAVLDGYDLASVSFYRVIMKRNVTE